MASLRTAFSYMGMEMAEGIDHASDHGYRRAFELFACMPCLLAAIFRARKGQPYIAPDPTLGFSENFFHMCFGEVPAKEVVRCFDRSMILYAEHSFNASTFTARTVASTMSGMYSAVSAAIGTLKGPLHGGANEAVMEMMLEVGNAANAKQWMNDALAQKKTVMGFGHRVYKNGDSRVPSMRAAFKDMVDIIDTDEARDYWQMSQILEREMVDQKGIHPNLDFPAGPAYYLMGFDIPMYTPLFVLARITGWTAHIIEQHASNKLIRPLSVYIGAEEREVTAIEART